MIEMTSAAFHRLWDVFGEHGEVGHKNDVIRLWQVASSSMPRSHLSWSSPIAPFHLGDLTSLSA